MRVSKEQVEQNRLALVEAAGRLLRNRGLEGAGVAEICREAGLTHGAFYRHFESREALMLEACARAFNWTPLDLRGAQPGAQGTQGTRAIVESYLSLEHRDCADLGCPVAALAVDAARAGGEIAEGFAEGIEAYLSGFTAAVRSDQGTASANAADADAQALHMLSTMIGGLILARATAQARPQLSGKILRTMRERIAGDLEGEPRKPRSGRSA